MKEKYFCELAISQFSISLCRYGNFLFFVCLSDFEFKSEVNFCFTNFTHLLASNSHLCIAKHLT